MSPNVNKCVTSPCKREEGIYKFYATVDRQITKNFREANIETRPSTSNGLWCCVLVPAVLIIYSLLYNVSQCYLLMVYLSIGQLSYSLLFIMFLFMSPLILYEKMTAGCFVSSVVGFLLIHSFTERSTWFAMFISISCTYLYSILMKNALCYCPKTFTIGEVMVVSQGATLLLSLGLSYCYFNNFEPGVVEIDTETTFITIIVATVLSTVGLIVTALYTLKPYERNIENLIYIVGLGALYTLLVLHLVLGQSFLVDFIRFMIVDYVRISLFVFWLILVQISVVITIVYTKSGYKATTETRKYFHITASFVFLTGILNDVNFLILASGIMFGVIIFIEALRQSKIQPVSDLLESAFEVYCDEKDIGAFAASPIYLYAGLATPVLLVPAHAGAQLDMLSGVMAVGVGDSAASWAGSRYGRNKWPDGKKSVEGTLFNIISQILFILILHLLGILVTPWCLGRTVVAAIISGLVEARLAQVDNLILPLVNLLAFQVTSVLLDLWSLLP